MSFGQTQISSNKLNGFEKYNSKDMSFMFSSKYVVSDRRVLESSNFKVKLLSKEVSQWDYKPSITFTLNVIPQTVAYKVSESSFNLDSDYVKEAVAAINKQKGSVVDISVINVFNKKVLKIHCEIPAKYNSVVSVFSITFLDKDKVCISTIGTVDGTKALNNAYNDLLSIYETIIFK